MQQIYSETVRIRFAGSQEAETFHMSPVEIVRFHSDWKLYLNGMGSRGGEYTAVDGDHDVLVAINFTQISYTEPGKRY